MFAQVGRAVARHPAWVLLLWVVAAVALFAFAPPWETRCLDDDIRFLPERSLTVRGHELLARAFPKDVFSSKAVFVFERRRGVLTAEDLEFVDAVTAELRRLRDDHPELALGTILSYREPIIGRRLVSGDQQCTVVLISLETPFLAFKTAHAVRVMEAHVAHLQAQRREKLGAADPLQVVTTGPAAMGRDLNAAAYAGMEATTIATVILVIVVLTLMYRSPLLVLVPLVTVGGAVWMALQLLSVMTLLPSVQLVNITRILVIVTLYGAGTDYCLFLISRYREEMSRGCTTAEATELSLARVGAALTASAGTVICGLAMMGFAEFAKLRYSGPAIAMSLVVALLASLTLAPALLRILGPAALWDFRTWLRLGRRTAAVGSTEAVVLPFAPTDPATSQGFWEWFSHRIAAHPLRIWLVSTCLLLPLAWLGYHTELHFAITEDLPRDAASRRGLEVISRHFTPGEVSPLTILIRSHEDWNTPKGRRIVARLTSGLQTIPNVAEVRSLTQPLGREREVPEAAQPPPPPGTKKPLVPRLKGFLNKVAQKAASTRYVSHLRNPFVTRLEVVFRTEPFAKKSIATMKAVQAYLDQALADGLEPVVSYELYGMTSLAFDIADVHTSDRLLVNTLVLCSISLILLILVRKPLLTLYLLVTVLFGYFVTLGVTELISYAWLDSKLGQVDWKVPFFLFNLLVAIGEDYNIFLITRIEEESRLHPGGEGTRRALARTGGTITACGLIMAGTFATLTLCQLTTLVELGIAFAVGVLVDTFLVRPILVPAFLLMWQRRRTTETKKTPAPAERPALRKSA